MLEQILSFCQRYLQLQPLDLVMISIGTVLFVAFWKLMGRLVIGPYVALIEERERAASDPLDAADNYRKQAADLEAEFQNNYLQARGEALQKKGALLAEQRRAALQRVAGARDSAQKQLQQAREQLSERIGKFRDELGREAEDLEQGVVSRIMAVASNSDQRTEH